MSSNQKTRNNKAILGLSVHFYHVFGDIGHMVVIVGYQKTCRSVFPTKSLEHFKVKMNEQLAVKDEQLEALNKKIKALEAKVEDSTTADDTKQGAFPTTQDMKQSDEVPL